MAATIATKRTPATSTKRAESKVALQGKIHRWASAYIILSMLMSAGLNGYANAEFARPELKVWAWGMGIMIPVLVLILSRVAGLLYKSKARRLAYLGGAVAGTLLTLSVWHCASSIALLTGSNMGLALAFAVGIDVGLVTCEIAGLQTEQ